MDLQQKQSFCVKNHGSWKRAGGWGTGRSELCRAVPYCSTCAPLICFTGIHGTEQGVGTGMGGAEYPPLWESIHPLMHHTVPSGPPLLPRGTEQGWLQQQHHWAVPRLGGSQPCALKQLDRVTSRGKVAQLASGVLSICFAHFQNQFWLKKFFSSCRNLQSLAHSPICHFVLHHALFQEVELPMIS